MGKLIRMTSDVAMAITFLSTCLIKIWRFFKSDSPLFKLTLAIAFFSDVLFDVRLILVQRWRKVLVIVV